jgi:hypothetical protein
MRGSLSPEALLGSAMSRGVLGTMRITHYLWGQGRVSLLRDHVRISFWEEKVKCQIPIVV